MRWRAKDAKRLTILGTGEQAVTHARAISKVRKLETLVRVGPFSGTHAQKLAEKMRGELGIEAVAAPTTRVAVVDADIVCTVTSSRSSRSWKASGCGLARTSILSDRAMPGQSRSTTKRWRASRFFVDSREGVLAQGAEFLNAKKAGLIGDDHIVGEIGEVLAGKVEGRRSDEEITAYKSLGHIVQDLASAWALYAEND